MNTNLVILPTRSRPDNAERCINALKEHSVMSDFVIAIDDDQSDLYPRLDGVTYEVNPRLRMNGTLNLVANKYADKYETIFFLGDDHLVQTPSWDEYLTKAIRHKGYGLAYGNDLLQKHQLATAVMMSTNIIKAVGYMAPPKLVHLYMDNYWMILGQRLGTLWYFDNVIIEHLHPVAGKVEWDEQYREANSNEVANADRMELHRYMEEDFAGELEKITTALGL
jgi:GT2 family glycosyltransferase